MVEDLPENGHARAIGEPGGHVENEAASHDPAAAVVDVEWTEESSAASLGLVVIEVNGGALPLEGDPPHQLSKKTELDGEKGLRSRHGPDLTDPSEKPGSCYQFGKPGSCYRFGKPGSCYQFEKPGSCYRFEVGPSG